MPWLTNARRISSMFLVLRLAAGHALPPWADFLYLQIVHSDHTCASHFSRYKRPWRTMIFSHLIFLIGHCLDSYRVQGRVQSVSGAKKSKQTTTVVEFVANIANISSQPVCAIIERTASWSVQKSCGHDLSWLKISIPPTSNYPKVPRSERIGPPPESM